MAYVILGTCEKDDVCKTACPDDAISFGTVEVDGVAYDQYFIDPDKCNECGTCESVCPTQSIVLDLDLSPKEKHFQKANAAFFTS